MVENREFTHDARTSRFIAFFHSFIVARRRQLSVVCIKMPRWYQRMLSQYVSTSMTESARSFVSEHQSY